MQNEAFAGQNFVLEGYVEICFVETYVSKIRVYFLGSGISGPCTWVFEYLLQPYFPHCVTF